MYTSVLLTRFAHVEHTFLCGSVLITSHFLKPRTISMSLFQGTRCLERTCMSVRWTMLNLRRNLSSPNQEDFHPWAPCCALQNHEKAVSLSTRWLEDGRVLRTGRTRTCTSRDELTSASLSRSRLCPSRREDVRTQRKSQTQNINKDGPLRVTRPTL